MSHFFELDEIEEYVKCRDDIFYFSEKYLGIDLTPNQKSIIESYQNHNKVIVECPRRRGKTTVNMVWMIWNLIFQISHRIGFMGHSHQANKLTFANMRGLVDALPPFFTTGICRKNEVCIETKDKSYLRAFAPNTTSMRGYSLDNFIWEEYNHIDHQTFKDILQNIMPTIDHTGGNIFLVSGYSKHHMALSKSGVWYQHKVPLFEGNGSGYLLEDAESVNECITQWGGLNNFLRQELG